MIKPTISVDIETFKSAFESTCYQRELYAEINKHTSRATMAFAGLNRSLSKMQLRGDEFDSLMRRYYIATSKSKVGRRTVKVRR